MKIFSIAGWSKSGKTVLISRLIEAFHFRGKRVAALKHAPDGYDLQPEAKDSRRFLDAGADDVFLVAEGELIQMTPLPAKTDPFSQLQSRFHPDDIVLMEGYYQEGIPIIEVFKPMAHEKPKFPFASLAALVSDTAIDAPIPCLDENNLEGIVRFIEEYHG